MSSFYFSDLLIHTKQHEENNQITRSLSTSSPNSREDSLKIAAEDQLDILIALLAADQPFGQIVHPFGMIEAFNIDSFAKAVELRRPAFSLWPFDVKVGFFLVS